MPKARAGDAALRETILEVLRVTAEQISVQLHGGKGVK
jgi:hypothetical protein